MKKEVTQELLGKYHELCGREKEVQMQRKTLRTELLQLHQQGASVQPGRFQLHVTTKESVRLSWPLVAKVFGKDACDCLREQIPPSSSTYVSVLEKPSVSILENSSDSSPNPNLSKALDRLFPIKRKGGASRSTKDTAQTNGV